MSAARNHIIYTTRTCLGNDGKVINVVECKEAIIALEIQKEVLLKFFRDFLLGLALEQAFDGKVDLTEFFNSADGDFPLEEALSRAFGYKSEWIKDFKDKIKGI